MRDKRYSTPPTPKKNPKNPHSSLAEGMKHVHATQNNIEFETNIETIAEDAKLTTVRKHQIAMIIWQHEHEQHY